VQARFELISASKTVIRTDQPIEYCIAQALAALR
jgi:hypothetical protein